MTVECIVLERANQLARSQGLLERGADISCPYVGEEDSCDTCKLEKEPKFITIYLRLNGDTPSPTPKEKFTARLKRWQEINNKK